MSLEDKAMDLVKPVYEDALQPAVQELGQGLKAALSVLMAPLKVLGIASDAHLQAFKEGYEAKIKNIPEERLTQPDMQIAGNVLGVLAYTVHEPELREMFEKLLAAASDSETADQVHPSFVEIIKQLTPQEAHILRALSEFVRFPICQVRDQDWKGTGITLHTNVIALSDAESIDQYAHFIDNWMRLRIVDVDYSRRLSDKDSYSRVYDFVKEYYPDVEYPSGADGQTVETHSERRKYLNLGILDITDYGKRFFKSCL